MSEKNILAVVIRIGAIVLIIDTLRAIPINWTFYSGTEEHVGSIFMYFTLLPSVVAVCIALLASLYPLLLLKGLTLGQVGEIENADQLVVGLFAAIGLYILATGLSDLVYWQAYSRYFEEAAGMPTQLPISERANIMATIAEIVIGIGLMLGAKGLQSVLKRIRGTNL